MACCGGGGKSLRKQYVERSTKVQKQVVVQRINRSEVASPQKVEIKRKTTHQRQSVLRDMKCPKCGSSVVLVNIVGRERRQCSSANCRYIIRSGCGSK